MGYFEYRLTLAKMKRPMQETPVKFRFYRAVQSGREKSATFGVATVRSRLRQRCRLHGRVALDAQDAPV